MKLLLKKRILCLLFDALNANISFILLMANEKGTTVCSADIWCWSHNWQKILSHVSQNNNSSLVCESHLGITSRRWLTIRSNNWLTRKDGGNEVTPPRKTLIKCKTFLIKSMLNSLTSWKKNMFPTDRAYSNRKKSKVNEWMNKRGKSAFISTYIWSNRILVVNWQFVLNIDGRLYVNMAIISVDVHENQMNID